MKELKEQIIEAVQDATDTVDGTVSIPILDHFLDGILSEQLRQPEVVRSLPINEEIYKDLRTHVVKMESLMRQGNYDGVLRLFMPLLQKLENLRQ